MKIGYLMNTYPVTSGTFIRREIHALERLGADITRFAVRRWDQDLVDPADQAEAIQLTHQTHDAAGAVDVLHVIDAG